MINRFFYSLKFLFVLIIKLKFADRQTVTSYLIENVNHLGGLYIKLLQFLSLRTELFHPEEKSRFLYFYDQAPIQNIDVIKCLRQNLPSDKLRLIKNISNVPAASGSFAQVYKAQLDNGQLVAIKIQRPNLKRQLAVDFLILELLATIFDVLHSQSIINVNKTVKEFKRITYDELNYKKEADNAVYFYSKYKNHNQVYVPETYLSFCTEKIIVQEFVEAIPITKLIRLKLENDAEYQQLIKLNMIDMKQTMTNLIYELIIQGSTFDRYYADPHPGNVHILPKGKLVFLDFGLVVDSPTNRRNYFNILKGMIPNVNQMDINFLSREFLELGATRFFYALKKIDQYFGKANLLDKVVDAYQLEIEKRKEKLMLLESKEEENFSKLSFDMIDSGRMFRVSVPPSLFAVIRSIALFKSYHEILEPGHHPVRNIYKQVVCDLENQTLINSDTIKNINMSIETAIEVVLDMVSDITETHPILQKKLMRSIQSELYA